MEPVCAGVRGYVQVCVGVQGCAQVCAEVCKCMFGMNFQNTYWRLESLRQTDSADFNTYPIGILSIFQKQSVGQMF